MKILQMYTDYKEYNYETPKMSYDKDTGELVIEKPKARKEKKIIRGVAEIEEEQKKLLREANLPEDGQY